MTSSFVRITDRGRQSQREPAVDHAEPRRMFLHEPEESPIACIWYKTQSQHGGHVSFDEYGKRVDSSTEVASETLTLVAKRFVESHCWSRRTRAMPGVGDTE